MKKSFLLIAAVFLAAAVEGSELLRNSRFENPAENGVPAGWILRDIKLKPELPDRSSAHPAVSVKNGTLKLDTQKGRFEVMLIQFRLPLKRSEHYLLEFEVRRIEEPVSYRSVIHYQTSENGKRVWKNTSGSWLSAPEQWTRRTIKITLPRDSGEPYLYFAASGIGSVEIRNVVLRSPGIILKADRAMPVIAPGDSVKYQVVCKESSANAIRYRIRDYLERIVAEGTVLNDEIICSGLPNGWFCIEAEEIDSAGKSVSSRSAAFAVIPEVPDAVRTSPGNQFGVMVNPHTSYPFEQKVLDAEYAARIGVRYIRTHRLNWGRAQSGPDMPFNWNEADRELALYRQYGLRPVATIGWPVPAWASEADGTGLPNKMNYFPKSELIAQMQNYYRELAARAGDGIAYYEVGNEVDASNFWMGRIANAQSGNDDGIFNDFKEFYTLVASSVLAGSPSALIGPGTTGAVPEGVTYKPWLERFWSDPQVLQNTTIFCPHYKTDIDAIRAIMKKYGKEVPIVLTEIGGLVNTENYKVTPALLRQIIKRTYVQYATQLNKGGRALCKFLLRRIPEVREGWISEMLDSDYTLRPEYVAYATLIRQTAAGNFERELNLTRNASKGWVEAYRIAVPGGTVNLVMLNDADTATVTFESPDTSVIITDVMGVETVLPVENGKIKLSMHEDQPLFIHGELRENPGPVKHPEPELVLSRTLSLKNGSFEQVNGDQIAGWSTVVDETGGKGGKAPFLVEPDEMEKTAGKRSLKMSSEIQTRWYGILCELPMSEIPTPEAGEYLVFKISYDQKGEKIVGTGAGVTLAFRSADMRRLGFNDGNWARGTFDWTSRQRVSRQYPAFPRGTEKVTLEFYLGIATGTVWIDNVKVDIELYRKSNASSEYIN